MCFRPRHVELRLRGRLRHPRDVLVSRRQSLVGAVGARPARRMGRVHRSDAVLRLRAAEPDGAADRAGRGCRRFTTLLAIGCSVIMLLFLSQGGGRRHDRRHRRRGASLVWIQAQPGPAIEEHHDRRRRRRSRWRGRRSSCSTSAAGGIEEFRQRGSDYDYLHVDDNFLRLAQVIEIVPKDQPFVGVRAGRVTQRCGRSRACSGPTSRSIRASICRRTSA